jgi:uncharacterized membrane protein HdeD (DUF308 family)
VRRHPAGRSPRRLTEEAMVIDTMLVQLSKNWGWIVLRGVAAILFGILSFAWPGITLTVLVLLWGAYALIDGAVALTTAFRVRPGGKPMWSFALLGLVGIAAGVVTFARPGITAIALLALIATWAMITGVLEIVAAIRFRKMIPNEWLLGLAGLLSVVFGVLLVAQPRAGALTVVWLIAWYAILLGLALTMLGFRIRSLPNLVPRTA